MYPHDREKAAQKSTSDAVFFYRCLAEMGELSAVDLPAFVESVKTNLPNWISDWEKHLQAQRAFSVADKATQWALYEEVRSPGDPDYLPTRQECKDAIVETNAIIRRYQSVLKAMKKAEVRAKRENSDPIKAQAIAATEHLTRSDIERLFQMYHHPDASDRLKEILACRLAGKMAPQVNQYTSYDRNFTKPEELVTPAHAALQTGTPDNYLQVACAYIPRADKCRPVSLDASPNYYGVRSPAASVADDFMMRQDADAQEFLATLTGKQRQYVEFVCRQDDPRNLRDEEIAAGMEGGTRPHDIPNLRQRLRPKWRKYRKGR